MRTIFNFNLNLKITKMQNERLFRSSKEKEHNVRPAEEHKVCYNKNLCIFCSSFFAPLYRLHEIWLWRVLKLIAIANNKIVKKFFSYPCSLKRRIFGTIFWYFFGNESIRAWISKNVQVPCLTNNQSKSVSSKFCLTNAVPFFSACIYQGSALENHD